MALMTRITMGLLVVLLAAALAPANPPGTPSDTYTFKSRNYEVSTNVERKLADQIADHMDSVYSEYARRFSEFHVNNAGAVPLFVFRTTEQYLQFLKSRNIDGSGSGGMYFAGPSGTGLATFIEGQGGRLMFHTLQHEGFHQFAALRISANMPSWANEGIAEYFGEAYLIRGHFVTGAVPPERLERVASAIKKDKQFPLRELVEMSHETWNGRVQSGDERAMLEYDQAWSVIQFLIEGEHGRYTSFLDHYLHAINQGQQNTQAFSRVFGSGYTDFEDAWKKYMLTVQPDPVSEAADKLDVLAHGLRWLLKQDVTVESFAQLHDQLKAAKFKVKIPSHAGVRTISAENDAMFEPPDSGDRRKPAHFVFSPPINPKLPPGLAVDGLKVKVRVKWTLGVDGKISQDVVFE
jgi:hypothetical protein